MLQKRKFLAASSVGLAITLILTLALSILPKAFATVDHLDYLASGLYESDQAQIATVSLIATDEIDIVAASADFAVHETTDGDKNFTLTEVTYSEKFDTTGEVNSEIGEYYSGFFWTPTGDDSLVFDVDEVILTGTYEVAADAPAGTYNISLENLALDFAGAGGSVSGEIVAQVTITAKTAQEISYAETEIEKVYGADDFTNPLTQTVVDEIGGAVISFESSNENVATVDEYGEVHIVGAGETTITATASETETHAEATASYTLMVAKKALSIVSASVPDKTYDGTTDSEVGVVELSDGSLTQGNDYTVTAELSDATVGTDRTATVTVTLADEIAGNYDFATNTYEIEDITISPYNLTEANVSLEYDAVEYDDTDKEPTVTVTIGDFVVDSDEYEVSYANNHNPGTAAVTVTAKEGANVVGAPTKYFEITQKYVLEISGIDDQTVTYTGSPVVLVGNLTVAENPGNISANDLTTTWYASDGMTVIEQPATVGEYIVEYSYNDVAYEGALLVNFEITKATSPNPAEMTSDFRVLTGSTLAEIPGTRTPGFVWADPNVAVAVGANTYAASYTYDNDTTNYTTLDFAVSVYGLTTIAIDASVDGVGGAITAPTSAIEGDKFSVVIEPSEGYEIKKVTLNGLDITGSVQAGEFEVTASTNDINIVVTFRRIYQVVEGDGKDYVIGSGNSAMFVINADYALFATGGKLYMDGWLMEPSQYTVASGSTVITISADYLKTLSAGMHTVTAEFADGGIATAVFTLSSSSATPVTPDTGLFTAISGGAKVAGGLTIISALIGAIIMIRKKFLTNKVDFDKK